MVTLPRPVVKGGSEVVLEENLYISDPNGCSHNATVTFRAGQATDAVTLVVQADRCTEDMLIVTDGNGRSHKNDTLTISGDNGLLAGHAQIEAPVNPGEVCAVNFDLQVDYDQPLTSFYRQSGEEGLKELLVAIAFESKQLPRHVWQAELMPDGAVDEKEVTLLPCDEGDDTLKCVRLHLLDVAANRTLGFRWEW